MTEQPSAPASSQSSANQSDSGASSASGDAPSPRSQSPVYVGGGGRGLPAPPAGQNLADILERVLDKGVVIVGDIQVRLLDIELLTIKIRLLVASVERAREMGINWWEGDPFVSTLPPGEGSNPDRQVADRSEGQDRQT